MKQVISQLKSFFPSGVLTETYKKV